MIRFFGALLIVLASFGLGTLYSLLLKKECRVIAGFISLFRLIRARIECFDQPLYEIYRDFESPELSASGFISELRENGFIPALEKCRPSLSISDSAYSVLSEAGSELGKSSSSEQIRHCDRYIRILEDISSELCSELPRRSKAAKSLSCALGIMTAIILF